MVDEESFQRLAEVLHEMKPVHHLHRLGCPPANAVGVEIAPIPTDHGDRRMLSQPLRPYDALHLACALAVREAITRQQSSVPVFVAADDALLAAAAAERFPVDNPLQHP